VGYAALSRRRLVAPQDACCWDCAVRVRNFMLCAHEPRGELILLRLCSGMGMSPQREGSKAVQNFRVKITSARLYNFSQFFPKTSGPVPLRILFLTTTLPLPHSENRNLRTKRSFRKEFCHKRCAGCEGYPGKATSRYVKDTLQCLASKQCHIFFSAKKKIYIRNSICYNCHPEEG
jgi:hypothetical protein